MSNLVMRLHRNNGDDYDVVHFETETAAISDADEKLVQKDENGHVDVTSLSISESETAWPKGDVKFAVIGKNGRIDNVTIDMIKEHYGLVSIDYESKTEPTDQKAGDMWFESI